jgi:hypothetical protein
MPVEKGRMINLNFDKYEIMRLIEMPVIETVIVPSHDFWGGANDQCGCAGGAQRHFCGNRQAGTKSAPEEREVGVVAPLSSGLNSRRRSLVSGVISAIAHSWRVTHNMGSGH